MNIYKLVMNPNTNKSEIAITKDGEDYIRIIPERSKNNVSRYFNQAYYVYYEVKYENRKNRYKISPIGYSEAILTIGSLRSFNDKEA